MKKGRLDNVTKLPTMG